MEFESKTTMDHINTARIQVHDHKIRSSAMKARHFILHFLEMLLAMMIGMPIFFMLRNQIPAYSGYAVAFVSGTKLYDLAMGVSMTVPMVAWMIVRGHGWRHSAEMAFAMFAPVAIIFALRLLVTDATLPWLSKVSHLAMLPGMIIAMLYRRDHYTAKSSYASHEQPVHAT